MIDERDRARRESAAAVARRKAEPREDVHEGERQRALERYLDAEMYVERHETAPETSAGEDVEAKVRARRQHDAAEQMHEQARGADEVPR